MKKVCKELADSSILKSKANVKRKQYFQESFQLSLRIQLFPWLKLEYTRNTERKLEHGCELGFEPGLRTRASFAQLLLETNSK